MTRQGPWNIVQVAKARAIPWRNGGGMTRELLTWPATQDWLVRVSVADIEKDGPFSSFDGIDRYFAVLEGQGVNLGLPQGKRTITANGELVAFDGALAPDCALINGTTRDLNIMIKRNHADAQVRSFSDQHALQARSSCHGVFVTAASTLVVDEVQLSMPGWSLAWSNTDLQASTLSILWDKPLLNPTITPMAFVFSCVAKANSE